MGCSQSKIENEEAVLRCKNRKLFMKEAVASRNAFAAAHSSYAISLKNTGAALSDYAHAEVPHHSAAALGSPAGLPSLPTSVDSAVPPPPPKPGMENLPPPPPPVPDFAAQPLQRAASMPEMKLPKAEAKVGPTIIEEDEMEFESHDNEKLVRKRSSNSNRGVVMEEPRKQPLVRGPPASQLLQQDSTWDYFFPPVESMPAPTLANPVEVEVPPTVAVEEEEEVVAKPVVEPAPTPAPAPPAVEVEVVPEKRPAKKVGPDGGRRGGKVMNLIDVFVELDDHFLEASKSAHEVSKMLEATRLHYHSNFADNRGHIDHSKRVMRVITWNRSFKGLANVDDGKDELDLDEHETHATVLDKMLAWEKKLYDEVKAGEIMKYDYQRKVNALNKLKNRGTNSESLEKLKATVSQLHTRYIVDMQSMDSTVSEINRLRDEQLYPKLVQLVEGMATMWNAMRSEHESQLKLVISLRSWDLSQSPLETTEHHHDRTCQLGGVVQEWHNQFCGLIDFQKSYIKSLNSWLKLNLVPIESNLREKVSSPPRVENPPIRALLQAWHDFLETLPDEVARTAIGNFAAVIDTIVQHQLEELRLKVKCDSTRRELAKKTRQFEDWYSKYIQRRIPDEGDPERTEVNPHDEAVTERQVALEVLKKQLEEEEDTYKRQCLQVREKSLSTLKARLPELFRAMSDIARACSEMYRNLYNISQHRRRNQASS